MPSTLQPYSGPTRKLVLALDVGTTFSGVSYTLLEPGKVPEVRGVTRFPAQEHVGSDSKVPSVLFYDSKGEARAIGAEALQEAIIEQAEDEKWIKVEWFKLRLRPKGVETSHIKNITLPKDKTIVEVYADFLKYLLACTKNYIESTHPNGQVLWDLVKDEIDYVITHPNGWEGPQLGQLRRAAVEAGLIPDNMGGQTRIQFLTEGEAGLHFCVHHGLDSDVTRTPGKGIVIVDAGGGTVDVSAFAPLENGNFEEISVAQCSFQGSVFVTLRAKDFLQKKFANTKFAGDVPTMAIEFDRTTKLRFRNEDDSGYIKFGGLRDKDLMHNIRAGQLTLKGTDVAGFFKPSVDAITQDILNQATNSRKPVSNVFLVGGFGSSEYLLSKLRSALESQSNISLSRPDGHVNKAVADGAVYFYLERLVSVRVARFDYGTEASLPFHPLFMDRIRCVVVDPLGDLIVPGHFATILEKGTQVSETQMFTCPIVQCSLNPDLMNQAEVEIKRYQGKREPCPLFLDMDKENFITHCKITGDLSAVPKHKTQGRFGWFYQMQVDVNITFGPAEMEAHLSWEEHGIKKRGPAQIIYDGY